MTRSNIFLSICLSFISGIGIASFLPKYLLNLAYLWLIIVFILIFLSLLFIWPVAEYQIVLNSQISVNLSKKKLANITTLPKFFLNKFTRNLKIYAKPGIWRQALKKKKKVSLFMLILSFLFLGILRFYWFIPVVSNEYVNYYNGSQVDIVGVVDNYVEKKISNQKIVLNVYYNNITQDRIKGKILLHTSQFPRYNYGDKLSIKCKLKAPEEFNGFDYPSYLAMQNIYSVCYFPQIEKINNKEIKINPILLRIFAFKKKMSDTLDKGLNAPQSGIAKAILLGDKTGIDDDTRNIFSRAGLSHIVAISGMHIAILIAIIFLLLSNIGFSRKNSFYLSTVFLIIYIVLIGMPASAVRAGIMSFLVLLAFNIGRLNNIKNSFILAATVILLVNPMFLRYNISFQLSFLAVLGIIYFYPILEDFSKKIHKNNKYLKMIFDIFNVSISAQIFTMPLIALKFSVISLISPISNLLVLWILPFLLISGFLGLFLSLFWSGYVFLFLAPISFMIKYVYFVAEFLNKIPLAYINFF